MFRLAGRSRYGDFLAPEDGVDGRALADIRVSDQSDRLHARQESLAASAGGGEEAEEAIRVG